MLSVTLLVALLHAQVATPAPLPEDAAMAAQLAEAAPRLAAAPGVTLTGYRAEGRNPRAIRASMNAFRPAERGGNDRFDSVTRWSYALRRSRGADGQCALGSAEVITRITVILPVLAEREQLSQSQQADWDGYFAKLTAHEFNHIRIATLGAERMQAAMRAAASCDAMAAAQQQVGNEVREASREYDRITEHGHREGIVYPPR